MGLVERARGTKAFKLQGNPAARKGPGKADKETAKGKKSRSTMPKYSRRRMVSYNDMAREGKGGGHANFGRRGEALCKSLEGAKDGAGKGPELIERGRLGSSKRRRRRRLQKECRNWQSKELASPV